MANVDDLPDSVKGGDEGHTSAHETIHQALKAFKEQVNNKADKEYVENLDRFLIYDTSREIWIEASTGTQVPPPKDGGLQQIAASLYMMLVESLPQTVQEKKVIPGPITVGRSDESDGFFRNHEALGYNQFIASVVRLDAPSTSGSVKLRFISTTKAGGFSWGDEIEIPEGVTMVIGNWWCPGLYSSSAEADNSDILRVEILEAGTGASGLTAQVLRSN